MESYFQNKDLSHVVLSSAMSQRLPINRLKWLKSENCSEYFIKNYDKNNDVEYFLWVDLKHPEELKKPDNKLPLLPEKMKMNKEKW